MSATGVFTDLYCYEIYTPTWEEYKGGACSCSVKWVSEWKSGNTHTITITVQGIRTDGSSASLFGHIKVGDNSTTSIGSQNYPGDPAGQETFDPVTYEVETDDYGNLLTPITVTVGFTRNSTEQHYAQMKSTGVVLEKPQKNLTINAPDGIICTVNKSPLYRDDQFVITITVTGSQWSDSPVISVTGATKIEDLTYQVTGDVYIAITGVLAKHTIHVVKSAGIEISIFDEINGYSYDDGSSVEHYTVLTILCEAKPGYKYGQLTVNDEKHNNGASIQVMSDVSIVAIADVLGLVRIFTGSTFEGFHIFIYNGSSWGMYIPLIYDGASWNICA